MSKTYEHYTAKVYSDFYDAIEATFRDKVQALEGCVITNEMIREHGSRLIGQSGRTILAWKGLPIVEWDAMPMSWSDDGTKATITFRA